MKSDKVESEISVSDYREASKQLIDKVKNERITKRIYDYIYRNTKRADK